MTDIIASDLDRTLIYSAAALGLTVPDEEAPRLLCVETYENKPLSYMTETAAALLASLTAPAAGDGTDFEVRGPKGHDGTPRLHLTGSIREGAVRRRSR